MCKLLTLFLLLFTLNSFTSEKGNGGVIVKCPGDKISLADFWEAKILHQADPHFSIQFDPSSSLMVYRSISSILS